MPDAPAGSGILLSLLTPKGRAKHASERPGPGEGPRPRAFPLGAGILDISVGETDPAPCDC
jgi:hypothetical protein